MINWLWRSTKNSDTICLPTGYGKSLCYQTLPFILDYKHRKEARGSSSAVLVVSPLVALMEDQASVLRKLGVKASILTTSASVAKELVATEGCLATDSLFFYAPEALIISKWQKTFEQPEFSGRIVAVIVDEKPTMSLSGKLSYFATLPY